MQKIEHVFEEMYQATYEKVLFFVLMKCGKSLEAEDILQEIYAELFWVLAEKGKGYITSPEGFVMQLAKSKIYRYYSEKERQKACVYVEDIELPEADEILGETGARAVEWEDALLDRLTAEEVMKYLSQKDELTKEIFYQHYFAGKTLEDIAKSYGVKNSTVKNRLYRTLKELRALRNVFCVLLAFVLLGWGLHGIVQGIREPGNVEATPKPTPTMCPTTALPSLWMNGKLYKVERIEKKDAAYDEAGYIGTVESQVAQEVAPTKEMESNILPTGTQVYKSRHADGLYIAVVTKQDKTYYYRIFEFK